MHKKTLSCFPSWVFGNLCFCIIHDFTRCQAPVSTRFVKKLNPSRYLHCSIKIISKHEGNSDTHVAIQAWSQAPDNQNPIPPLISSELQFTQLQSKTKYKNSCPKKKKKNSCPGCLSKLLWWSSNNMDKALRAHKQARISHSCSLAAKCTKNYFLAAQAHLKQRVSQTRGEQLECKSHPSNHDAGRHHCTHMRKVLGQIDQSSPFLVLTAHTGSKS